MSKYIHIVSHITNISKSLCLPTSNPPTKGRTPGPRHWSARRAGSLSYLPSGEKLHTYKV